jgi:hypothetical protein
VYDGRAGERPGDDYGTIVPALTPYAWGRFARLYRDRAEVMARPDDALFYHDEQAYYLDFARRLGCSVDPPPYCFLPGVTAAEIDERTLVLAPGCKTGEMAAKRWPYFPSLAAAFDDVVVVGTSEDLRYADGRPMIFPPHVRSLVDGLSLRELADLLAGCGAVVANDSGIGHMAAAVGVPVVLLFGPTPEKTLGVFPPNVTVVRAGLPCEPCWLGKRLKACGGRITCLRELSVSDVAALVASRLNPENAARKR